MPLFIFSFLMVCWTFHQCLVSILNLPCLKANSFSTKFSPFSWIPYFATCPPTFLIYQHSYRDLRQESSEVSLSLPFPLLVGIHSVSSFLKSRFSESISHFQFLLALNPSVLMWTIPINFNLVFFPLGCLIPFNASSIMLLLPSIISCSLA